MRSDDVMSSFGCKSVLRDAIITGDCWFTDAEKMLQYLKHVFADDVTEHYHIIDSETTANQRKQERIGHPLKGCMSFHMISVNPDGEFTTKQVLDISDDTLTSLNFAGDVIEEVADEVVEKLFEEDEGILDVQGTLKLNEVVNSGSSQAPAFLNY